MFDPSQHDVRRFFCGLWQRHREHAPLSPLEAMALDIVLAHPEYHDDLADEDAALHADYPVEAGRGNPFLHLSMHLAIAEQLSIDQPPGLRAAHTRISQRLDSAHEADHAVMECLGEIVWRAQRDGTVPDGLAYIECVERRARG